MFPPDSHRFCIPNLLVMSLPYILRANALPLLISHHIPPYLLSYPAWQISSDLLSAECIPGAKCDWLDLYRLKLVVWWSEWHLMWFVLPHAVSQFFWFSATLPLHHPELCHPKGLQAPKTSYDPRTGRDMLNFAFGTQAHCLEISWNHHQRLPAHLFICFILVSSFQWYLPSFKSSALENTVQWDVVLSFLCLCLSIEASWRLPILQLLPAPACPTMACIWCIAFRNRMPLYPLVLSMVRSCHENPNTSAALTSSQLDVNLPLLTTFVHFARRFFIQISESFMFVILLQKSSWGHMESLKHFDLDALDSSLHLQILHITPFAHGDFEDYLDLKPHTESNKLTRLMSSYGWNSEGFCYVSTAWTTGRDLNAFSIIEVRLHCPLASTGDGLGRSSTTGDMSLCYAMKAY